MPAMCGLFLPIVDGSNRELASSLDADAKARARRANVKVHSGFA